jgi:drug/metabolite transporter (DMT)-like permease
MRISSPACGGGVAEGDGGGTPKFGARLMADASLRAALSRLPANAQGAAWLAAAAFASAVQLIAAKGLSPEIGSFQIVFVRGAASFVLVAGLIPRLTWASLAPRRPILLTLRSALATASLFLLFYSVDHIPLADAQTLNFSQVLFLIPLSVLILRERVGVRRWGAVAVGFIGVLIVLRPTGAISPEQMSGALAGALGAACYAGMLVTVRMVARTMTADATYVWGIVGLAALSAPLGIATWSWPSGHDWLLLAGIGVLGATGQYAAVRAFAVGEASAIAPVDYLKLVFALLGGALFFAELPDLQTLLGAAVIVGATGYATYREARVRKERGRETVPTPPRPL